MDADRHRTPHPMARVAVDSDPGLVNSLPGSDHVGYPVNVPRQRTSSPSRTFTCKSCYTGYTTFRSHVMGVPIDQWWDSRGHECSACKDKEAAQAEDQSLAAQFTVFHKNNPVVYQALVREGRVLLARGHRKLGISMLYERLRWQVYVETTDDQYDFKLPNNYRAYYARLIMKLEPDFQGVFRLAELRSQR